MCYFLDGCPMQICTLVNDKLKDSVPTKMFEALGVGCPVLLAAVGDAAAILQECKLGMVVRPNDEEALWKAFLKIYTNLPEILQHREQAQKIICSKYSRQKAALLMEKELEKRFDRTRK